MTEPKILTEDELKDEASKEIDSLVSLEKKADELQMVLSNNNDFADFLEVSRKIKDKNAEIREKLLSQMVESNVKSVVLDDWGTITVVDSKSWSYDEELLPKKFIKKVVNTTLVNDTYKLSNKLPKGASFKNKPYIKMTPKKK